VIVVLRQLPGGPKVAGCSVKSAGFCKYAAGKLLDHSPDVRVRMLGMYGRALSFGVVAEAYERFRPAYPVELFDMMMAYAGQPVRTALEIGAGTGKATRLFAQRGVTVTAVEPDGAMLAGVASSSTR
jgi:SAM-dependent methyltransferase